MKSLITLYFLFAYTHCIYGITWKQIIDKARNKNLRILADRHSIYVAKKSKLALYAGHIPSISLIGSKVDSQRTILSTSLPVTDTKYQKYGFRVNWNIFDGFKTINQIKKASYQEQLAIAKEKTTLKDIRFLLRKSFFNTLVGKKKLAIAKKIKKRQKQNLKFIQLKYNGGLEAKWSVDKAQVDYKLAEHNLEKEKKELKKSMMELIYLLGEEDWNKNFTIEGSIEKNLRPIYASFENDLHHPDIKLLTYKVSLAKKQEIIDLGDFSPKITLTFEKTKSKIKNSFDQKDAALTLNLVLPLFNGFSTTNTYLATKSSRFAAEKELLDKKRRLKLETKKSQLDFESKLEKVPLAKQLLKAAISRKATVTKQYRSGLKSFIEWERAESQLIEAEKEELKTIAEALFAKANYEYNLGIIERSL